MDVLSEWRMVKYSSELITGFSQSPVRGRRVHVWTVIFFNLFFFFFLCLFLNCCPSHVWCLYSTCSWMWRKQTFPVTWHRLIISDSTRTLAASQTCGCRRAWVLGCIYSRRDMWSIRGIKVNPGLLSCRDSHFRLMGWASERQDHQTINWIKKKKKSHSLQCLMMRRATSERNDALVDFAGNILTKYQRTYKSPQKGWVDSLFLHSV